MEDNKSLIFGKDDTQHVVGLEINDGEAELFIQQADGTVVSEKRENRFWILSNRQITPNFKKLEGNLFFKYMAKTKDRELFEQSRRKWKNLDVYSIYNPREAFMVMNGVTYFKGMKHTEISVLSFDIETLGLKTDENSKILCISNTFRTHDNKIIKKLFTYDTYKNQGQLLTAWCDWVREMNPTQVIGHNILGYDLNYMRHIAKMNNVYLNLGRDGRAIVFNKYKSDYRIDGSRSIEYTGAKIYGREIIDTLFLSYKHGATRNYDSYSLKKLIIAEGLEKPNRVYYDASKIRDNYTIPEEWIKIKAYCEDDSDESLALYDLMNSSYFYFAQHIPKTYQAIIESATGSQINSFLVRSYLQDGHSIPKMSHLDFAVEGGISFAIPGVYRNLMKVDLKSAYPSQVLRFKLFDKEKDPNGNFYKMVKHFAEGRFELKKKYKETNDNYYLNLDASNKIFINSAFGVTNTPGLNFNSPALAAKITGETREVIKQCLQWASGKDLIYWKQLFEEKT